MPTVGSAESSCSSDQKCGLVPLRACRSRAHVNSPANAALRSRLASIQLSTGGKRAQQASIPTFGEFADQDQFVADMSPQGENQKHIDQWRMTLTHYAAPLRRKLERDRFILKRIRHLRSSLRTRLVRRSGGEHRSASRWLRGFALRLYATRS